MQNSCNLWSRHSMRKASQRKRRVVKRNIGGWKASSINQYVEEGDVYYRLKFRVTRHTFDRITKLLVNAGCVPRSLEEPFDETDCGVQDWRVHTWRTAKAIPMS